MGTYGFLGLMLFGATLCLNGCVVEERHYPHHEHVVEVERPVIEERVETVRPVVHVRPEIEVREHYHHPHAEVEVKERY